MQLSPSVHLSLPIGRYLLLAAAILANGQEKQDRGQPLAQAVDQKAKVIDDGAIAEYVNRLGQNIVRSSGAKVPFRIQGVESKNVSASSLPDGYYFVSSGLIWKVLHLPGK